MARTAIIVLILYILACGTTAMSPSWPGGPYALPMSKYGCHDRNYSRAHTEWVWGYINMTFTSSIRNHVQCRPAINTTIYDFDANLYQFEIFSHILGPFDDYNLQLNFCFKTIASEANATWLDGIYSVFGAEDGCPSGFTSREVTLCLPPILQWNEDGNLPYYTISTGINGTRMRLLLCDKNHTQISPKPDEFGHFMLVKAKDVECPFQTSEVTYPFPVYDETLEEVRFCLQQIVKRQIIDYYNPAGIGANLWMYLKSAEDSSYAGRFHRWMVFDCRINSFIDEIHVYGHPEITDSNSGIKITVSSTLWAFYNNGGQACLYRLKKFVEFSRYKCYSLLIGRYIALQEKINSSGESPYWYDSSTIISVYASKYTTVTDCHELGMQDYHIADYQLEASSFSSAATTPDMARPQLTGWCAKDDDPHPFYQIDLIKDTVVSGISIYNWEQIQMERNNKNTYASALILKGTRGFHIRYKSQWSGNSTMNLYKEKEFRLDLSRPFLERQTFPFLNPFRARYIRVIPIKAYPTEQVCLKLELLGTKQYDIHSLDCEDHSWKEMHSVSRATIRSSSDLIYYDTLTLDACADVCLEYIYYTKCMAIEFSKSRGQCKIYLSDANSPYTNIQLSTEFDDLLMANCPKRDYREYDDGYLTTALTTNPILITSTGYPFEHVDSTWANEFHYDYEYKDVAVVFTDISLMHHLDRFKSMNISMCTYGIVLDTIYEYYVAEHLDSRHNGLRLVISTGAYSLKVEYKLCSTTSLETTGHEAARGFRAYVFFLDKSYCYSSINDGIMGLCTKEAMVLHSFTFLGYPIKENTKYTWRIVPEGSYVAFEWLFEDFDISCQLDAKVSITDAHGHTLVYCNNNRAIGRQYFSPPYLEVTLQTSLTLQNVFVEGMKASYSLVLHKEANGGQQMQECSNTFNKCYHVYHNTRSIDWQSAAKECSSTGMNLVTIKNVDEMMFVKALLMRVWFPTNKYTRPETSRSTLGSHYVHIGLSRYLDETEEVHEVWTDGTPLTFTAWATNEPRKVRKQRCTRMDFLNYYDTNVWSSEPCHKPFHKPFPKFCSDVTTYYICELNKNELNIVDDEMHSIQNDVKEKRVTTGFESLFRCTNGELTSILHVCDGIANCRDASDEENCETAEDSCRKNQFKCGTGECIHVSGLCDFINDCKDASDEYCDHVLCHSDKEFQCHNSECVQAYKQCDGKPDCLDESDENTCDSCNETVSFHCDDVKCIPKRRVCDNVNDCSDWSDETDCEFQSYKTCDDVMRSGIRKTGVFKMITNQYMECDFDNIDNGTIIMKYWNIDWHVIQEDKEYVTNSDQFFTLALADSYSCFQNFTPILRPVDAMIVKLDKYDNNVYYDSAVFRIDSTTTDTGQVFKCVRYIVYPVSNHSHFDISKIRRNEYGLRVFIHTPFDNDKFRIPMGPIVCTKVVQNIQNNVFPCGYNMGPISSDEVCVYELSSDGKVKGCRNMEHLQNCAKATCRDGYVKCPDTFCIPAAYVCNGRIDCPNGQDEINCWCNDEPSTLIVAVYDANPVEQEYTFSMASRFFGPMRAVYVIHIRYYSIDPTFDIHKLTKPSEHVPEVYGYLNNLDRINNSQLFDGETLGGKLGFISVNIPEENRYLKLEMDILTSFKNDSWVEEINLYHLYFDSKLRMPATIDVKRQDELLNLTEIRVQQFSILSAMGPQLFGNICKENNQSVCKHGYVCKGARVCISLTQVCDTHIDCPFGDDERLCGFRCPTNCSCIGLSVMCNNAQFSWNDLKDFSDKIRSLVIRTTSNLTNNPLELYQTFHYLSIFDVSNTDISAISSDSLGNIPNVKTLDLRYNKIRTLEADTFVHLRHLAELLLEGNAFLTNIEPDVFSGLQLSDLSLKDCSLLSIKKYTFKGLDLKSLDISFNRIAEISDYAFDDLNAEHIDMSNNPVTTFGIEMFKGVTSVKSLITPAYKFCCIRPDYVNEDSCSPHQDEFSSCEDLMRNSALQALMWIIGIFALIGNLLSLGYRLIFDRKRLKIGYGIFVTNLAVADLLMGIYMLIIAFADTLFRNRYILMDEYWRSSWWCRISGVISTISSEASVLFISLITIDRILVVKFPFGQVRFTTKTANLSAAICWAITIILSIIPILHTAYFEDRFYTSRAVCIALPLTHDRPPGWLYSIVIFVGFNAITFMLIAIGQFLIYAEIRKSAKTRKMMNVSRKQDLTVARNLLMVVSTDFLCWFPIGCMGVMSMLNVPISSDVYAWTVVLILPINSAINPFMYTYSVLITKRNLNPSVDEQERTDVLTEFNKTIKKLLPRFQSYRHHLCPIENTLTVRKLKPTEVCHIWMALVEYIDFLHDNRLVAGNINEQNLLTEVDEKGEMKIGEVQFRDTPKMIDKTAEIATDIHEMGLFINRLLT